MVEAFLISSVDKFISTFEMPYFSKTLSDLSIFENLASNVSTETMPGIYLYTAKASCLLLKSGVIDILTYDIFINEKA